MENASSRIRILVLSDGKPGHYHQTQGILAHLPEADAQWVSIEFRSKRHDNWLRVQTLFFRRFLSEREWERVLTPHCSERLKTVLSPHVVLSTGSSVAAPNFLLAKRFGAKAVVCTRPSPLGIKLFDVAILARHQWTKETSRVIRVLGVPTPITPELVATRRRELEQEGEIPPTMGFLFGGNDKRYRWSVAAAETALEGLLDAARRTDRKLALVTSRRTPPDVEAFFRRRLHGESLCFYSAFAGEPVPKTAPVLTLFALSEWIAVTVDSFSMVCEACSSGKPVMLLTIPSRRRDRYGVSFDAIAQATGMRRVPIERVREAAENLTLEPPSVCPLRDAQTAAEGLRQWWMSLH